MSHLKIEIGGVFDINHYLSINTYIRVTSYFVSKSCNNSCSLYPLEYCRLQNYAFDVDNFFLLPRNGEEGMNGSLIFFLGRGCLLLDDIQDHKIS